MSAQHPTSAHEDLQAKVLWLERLHAELAEQLDELFVLASTAQYAEEARDEEHRDTGTIAMFRVIARLAGNAVIVNAARDQLKAIQAMLAAGHSERAPTPPGPRQQEARRPASERAA